MRVPQCSSSLAKEECSYLALRPKSANLTELKSFGSWIKMLSKSLLLRMHTWFQVSMDYSVVMNV